jgi:TRAP-type C4-dicarboxylate transport system substrate-binding protein
MKKISSKGRLAAALALPMSALLLVACASGGGAPSGQTPAPAPQASAVNPEVTLKIATTPPRTDPNFYCGVELLEQRVEAAGVGITIELFPESQLGPDTERFAALQAGDIDIDLQGASALSNSFPLFGTLDAAYVFDNVDHKFDWIDNYSSDLFDEFNAATGTTVLNGWFFGVRTYTATKPIRSPEDLAGLRMRFPNSPAFIRNAEAMGANAVPVAFEEIYNALSTGLADGQENPIPTTDAQSWQEPLSYASLNNHQIGIQWLVMNNDSLASLTDEQRDVLLSNIVEIRAENRKCVEDATNEILDRWVADGEMEVIPTSDINMAAFISKAEQYFLNTFEGEQLDLYKSIRQTAP